MKLSKHILFVDVDEEHKIMINALTGRIDKIDISVFEVINKWQQCENIVPIDDYEKYLFSVLVRQNYVFRTVQEEHAQKQKIIDLLRTKHHQNNHQHKHITFIVTYMCNFACAYCFENATNNQRHQILTIEQVDVAFDLLGDELESISLFGGEPLLLINKDVIEYIVTKAPNKKYNITTNGYYLDEYADILKNLASCHVMVTLDGDEHSHNKRRHLLNGQPTYHKIMNGISRCLRNHIHVCIRMNVDMSNIDDALIQREDLLQQYAEYKDLLSFEISPMMGALEREKTQIYEHLYRSDIQYDKNVRDRRNRFMGRFKPIVDAAIYGTRHNPVYSFCAAHNHGFFVDPYGMIYPCMPSVGIEPLSVGTYYPRYHLKEHSIRHRNIETISQCRECGYSLVCGGGCPLNLKDYSDVMQPDCKSIRYQLHKVLPVLYKQEHEEVL